MNSQSTKQLEGVGDYLKGQMQDKVMSNMPPPNAESTVRKKGSSHTLIDSGEMLANIDSKVTIEEDTVKIEVGVFDEEVALRAIYAEHGTPTEPARPFIRTTMDEEADKVNREVAEILLDDYINNLKEKLR